MTTSKDGIIDYVELPASDLPSTKSFFESVFGWTFQDWGDAYTSFSGSGIGGGFYGAEHASTVETGGALIVLYHSDLESTLETVREHGGTIMRDIFSFPGGRRFHFLEPSGNEFAVWSDQGVE